MGDVLNWQMPIEWDDGTEAQLTDAAHVDWAAGIANDRAFMLVASDREPAGWNHRTMPKLGLTKPVTVRMDGRLDCRASDSTAPRIRNVVLPTIRFPDGSTPVRGEIVRDGTEIRLWPEQGTVGIYSYPRFRPAKGSPKLTILTEADERREEEKAVETAAMAENPLFGLF